MKTFDEFLSWEQATKDSLMVRRIYLDMAGDLVAGLMLSQIVYWHLPSHDGDSRLRVKQEGEMWMARGRDDWWKELRITGKQVDRAIEILREKKLIITQRFKFGGAPTTHIRLIHAHFIKLLNAEIKKAATANSTKGEIHKRVNSQKGKKKLPQRERTMELAERSNSLHTETTTTEITTEITQEAPAAQGDELTTSPEMKAPFAQMLEAVADVCQVDMAIGPDVQKFQVTQTVGILRDRGETPEDVRFVGDWWWAHDWRAKGERARPPTPSELRGVWKQAFSENGAKGKSPPVSKMSTAAQKTIQNAAAGFLKRGET